jgi:hypothetical protein
MSTSKQAILQADSCNHIPAFEHTAMSTGAQPAQPPNRLSPPKDHRTLPLPLVISAAAILIGFALDDAP